MNSLHSFGGIFFTLLEVRFIHDKVISLSTFKTKVITILEKLFGMVKKNFFFVCFILYNHQNFILEKIFNTPFAFRHNIYFASNIIQIPKTSHVFVKSVTKCP